MADKHTTTTPHIVVVSSPGMGHVIPLAELTKLLVLRHPFTASLITFSSLPCSLPPSISTVQLPFPSLPSDTHIVTHICRTVAHSVEPLREILTSLRRTTLLAAVIFDLFGSDFLSMSKELGIPTYLFITSNLFFLSFMLHLPALHDTTAGEFRDLPEPLTLPGCVPLKGTDFLEPIQAKQSQACAWVVHLARHYDLFDGVLVNSFEALEEGAAAFLKKRGDGKPPVWAVGPLTSVGSVEKPSHECVEWLNRQPSESVVFVCFGSGGTLSWEQTKELALGLEMSGQRFLWVVRAPDEIELSGTFFDSNQSCEDIDRLGFIPEGFAERTKERGVMVLSWAPQQEILGHRAIGGFVSHCGWNSTLESLVNGVPMVAWPLYSEQRMNAVLVAEGAKVGLRAEGEENGVLLRREGVSKVVRELIEGDREGKEVRLRMREMKKEAIMALEKDGSSYRAMEEVVAFFRDSAAASK